MISMHDHPASRISLLFVTLVPLSAILLGTAFEYSGFDLWWVSRFYDLHTHSWPFKRHWFFKDVLHRGGQWFVMATAAGSLIVLVMTFLSPKLRPFRKTFLFFIIATAAGPLLVSLGKQLTHIYTPWDLQIFYGEQPYIRIFDPVPVGAPVGEAFPAGHSSGGFAFMSLYFLMAHHHLASRQYGLLFGIILGTLFGLTQQIRGAHFPSHDLFSLAICWTATLATSIAFYPQYWRRHP